MKNESLATEANNPDTVNIDQMSSSEILTIMNREDQKITDAIAKVIPTISEVVDVVVQSVKQGGRVFFVGAGTSGRLGIIEAAECPPTFGVDWDLFQGVIAGGERAIFRAVESAEDDREQGKIDLQERGITDQDVVFGIAASGKTPYVIGALEWAKTCGASSIALTCNENSLIGQVAEYKIEAVPGPEVISGSTRMKAGTTQKIILNMITSTAMIKVGKVYQNLMVDLRVSNSKLKERAINIIKKVTRASDDLATKTLEASNNNVKAAIVMIKNDVGYEKALQQLKENDGFVRNAIKETTLNGA